MSNPLYLPYPREADNAMAVARAVRPDASEFPVPPPSAMQYGEPPANHLAGGKREADALRRILADAGYDPASATRFMEFGCANGRVLRHLADWTKHAEGWGVDLNAKTLLWASENLRPPFKFLLNTTVPHLPFEDRSFSLIYAFSIFTHIEELWLAWLAELRRLVQPGGFAFVTIHDETALALVREGKFPSLAKVLASPFLADFETGCAGMLVHQRQVYFRRDYFLDRLSDLFEVASVTERAMANLQTGVLAKRRG